MFLFNPVNAARHFCAGGHFSKTMIHRFTAECHGYTSRDKAKKKKKRTKREEKDEESGFVCETGKSLAARAKMQLFSCPFFPLHSLFHRIFPIFVSTIVPSLFFCPRSLAYFSLVYIYIYIFLHFVKFFFIFLSEITAFAFFPVMFLHFGSRARLPRLLSLGILRQVPFHPPPPPLYHVSPSPRVSIVSFPLFFFRPCCVIVFLPLPSRPANAWICKRGLETNR